MKDAFIISDEASAIEYIKTTDEAMYREMVSEIEKNSDSDERAADFRKWIIIMTAVIKCFEKHRRKAICISNKTHKRPLTLVDCLSDEKHIVIDGRFRIIDRRCFQYCRNIESIRFSEGVRYIDEWALKGITTLCKVVLPKSLKGLGSECFMGCTNLEKVSFGNDKLIIGSGSFEGTAWLENIKGDFVVVNSQLIKYRGSEKCVRIPENVRIIPFMTFYGDENIEEVIIPRGVKEIGVAAFEECENLRKVTFEGDKLEEIGIAAFEYCYELEEIILPRKLKVLCAMAFPHATAMVYNGRKRSLKKYIKKNYPKHRFK